MTGQKQYHLIGIGGIGMSAIAYLLLGRGIKISGSDCKASKTTDALRLAGVEIFIGHKPSNIDGAQLIIYSSAIKEDNPEFQEAVKRGVSVIKRAQALVDLMADKTVIAVTGSHGKTTTSSLIAYLLLEAGLSPTIAVGGIVKNIDTNASFGKGDFFVAEADESDGTFLYYKPHYAVITNIDREHLDYYRDFAHIIEAYSDFMGRIREGGLLISCYDDDNLRRLAADYKNKYVLFGLDERADIYPRNILFKDLTSSFDCYYNNTCLGRIHLALGGRHNISNSLAVIALGMHLGIGMDVIKNVLSNYKGSCRRQEIKFRGDGCLVIDDYAHHPTEIKATLSAITAMPRERIIAVFQPHRYSRTQLLMDEFCASFDDADYVIITDIYAASEPPREGVEASVMCDKIKKRYPDREVHFVPKDLIVSHLLKIRAAGDLIITLGAGDIIKVCDELVEELKRKR
ncbi:MAG: UDP-N-acetylmuramate--L-alanine ligase [Candidatus Omnitrophota bacterium]|jgi:UDP-N-acetylmuramate--alanine ligase